MSTKGRQFLLEVHGDHASTHEFADELTSNVADQCGDSKDAVNYADDVLYRCALYLHSRLQDEKDTPIDVVRRRQQRLADAVAAVRSRLADFKHEDWSFLEQSMLVRGLLNSPLRVEDLRRDLELYQLGATQAVTSLSPSKRGPSRGRSLNKMAELLAADWHTRFGDLPRPSELRRLLERVLPLINPSWCDRDLKSLAQRVLETMRN